MALKRGGCILFHKCIWNKPFICKGYGYFMQHLEPTENHLYALYSMNYSSVRTEKESVDHSPSSNDHEDLGQVPLMCELIKKYKNNFSMNDFEVLKNKVLEKGNHVTDINFDAMFITQCSNENAFHLGKDYFNLVYSKGNCKIGVIGQFFKLCCNCSKECSEHEKKLMLDLYMKLLSEHEILDSKTCENVALGLSITNKWKECLKLLEMARFTSVPSSKMYSTIIKAAFCHNEINLAFDLLDEMINNKHIPHVEIFMSWLSTSGFTKNSFMKIFEFFEKYDLHPSMELVELLLNYYEKYHKKSKYSEITSIDKRGKCHTCFHQLNPVVVTEIEFQKLKHAFLDPVLIGKDMFLKTKPSELECFNNFLKKLEHIDFVLDGLNIALAPTHKNVNPGVSAQVLSNVVKHFINQSKNVLILGRKHMNLWPKEKMNYIKQNASLFLVENVSTDDPFLLYATMHFGLGTCFVSRDQMRGHRFLLKDPELRSIFSKWQQKHQYYFLYATEHGRVSFKEPVPYLQSVQQTKKGIWHIPISSDFTGIPAHLVPIKRKWLCFHEN